MAATDLIRRSLSTWARAALQLPLDVTFPKKWIVVRKNGWPAEPFSICSWHRSRAAAVLAIPVDGNDYGVTRAEDFAKMIAWAAFSAPDTMFTQKEDQ